MRLFVAVAALAFASPALSYNTHYFLTYSTFFDNPDEPINADTCLYGENGLAVDGHRTLGSLPSFPDVGMAPQMGHQGRQCCGTCWELTYAHENGATKSLNITVVDISPTSKNTFNVSKEAMDYLTGGQAKKLHTVNITASLNREGCP